MTAPRSWFQVHLSTCVVLMFVAGGLMWANVHRPPQPFPPIDESAHEMACYNAEVYCYQDARGWPWPFCEPGRTYSPPGSSVFTSGTNRIVVVHEDIWHFGALAIDIAIALAILFAVAFVLEWRIRRRSRSISR